jgi:hypothetical protein
VSWNTRPDRMRSGIVEQVTDDAAPLSGRPPCPLGSFIPQQRAVWVDRVEYRFPGHCWGFRRRQLQASVTSTTASTRLNSRTARKSGAYQLHLEARQGPRQVGPGRPQDDAGTGRTGALGLGQPQRHNPTSGTSGISSDPRQARFSKWCCSAGPRCSYSELSGSWLIHEKTNSGPTQYAVRTRPGPGRVLIRDYRSEGATDLPACVFGRGGPPPTAR